jgi:hypothetical protein
MALFGLQVGIVQVGIVQVKISSPPGGNRVASFANVLD